MTTAEGGGIHHVRKTRTPRAKGEPHTFSPASGTYPPADAPERTAFGKSKCPIGKGQCPYEPF